MIKFSQVNLKVKPDLVEKVNAFFSNKDDLVRKLEQSIEETHVESSVLVRNPLVFHRHCFLIILNILSNMEFVLIANPLT